MRTKTRSTNIFYNQRVEVFYVNNDLNKKLSSCYMKSLWAHNFYLLPSEKEKIKFSRHFEHTYFKQQYLLITLIKNQTKKKEAKARNFDSTLPNEWVNFWNQYFKHGHESYFCNFSDKFKVKKNFFSPEKRCD